MISVTVKIIEYAQLFLSLCFLHFVLYTVLGAFTTRRFAKAKTEYRYAVLIAARNEENVIGNLLESIRQQDYPEEKITVFVVADNCTDRTAEAARSGGAICYERFDETRCTKGYAMQFLMKNIHRDYGKDAFDGYFIFDADNLLMPDYIAKMNDAFDAGEKIITSYRHTKNFDDNWISASYAIHWLRTVRTEHRGRARLRLATRIQGTGVLLHEELLRDGWNFTSLTEDRELCAHAVADGERISFCFDAIFYDEQPTDLKIAFRQRLRWAKGNLWVFFHEGKRLLRGIFKTRGVQKFVCYDMLSIAFPQPLFSVILSVLLTVFCTWEAHGSLPVLLAVLFGGLGGAWLGTMLLAAYTLFMERARLPKMKWYRILWYIFAFPIFDLIGKITMCIALFTKVEWKPIPHVSDTKIEEMVRKS